MMKPVAAFAQSILIALALLLAGPALAQSDPDSAGLDQLFDMLKGAPNEMEARTITDQIWMRWTQPEDEALAESMDDLLRLRREFNLQGAMEIAEQIIAEHPEYAEGWNQRATLTFMAGDFTQSLADIDETLAREPRHFGALAGKAVIHLRLGQQEEARDTMIRALEVHPFLAERHLFPDLGLPAVQI